MRTCTTCDGTGEIKEATNDVLICKECGGDRSVYIAGKAYKCKNCNGKGYTEFKSSVCISCGGEGKIKD